MLENVLLPGLHDAPADAPRRWSIFDLDLATPPGYAMLGHTLSAGDLRLALAKPHGRATLPLIVRQVRPARLALSRQPLDRWLRQFAAESLRFHKPAGAATPTDLDVGGGPAAGLCQALRRRRRYGWLWGVPPRLHAAALHDAAGDRLLLLRAADLDTLRRVAATMRSADADAG